MTKRREPLTYAHTLTGVAAVIGWDRCGAICGVSERAVRNWSDPDIETEIRMIDAERLDRAFIASGGDHAPFHRLFALRLDIAQADLADGDLVCAAATAAKESGEAVSALIRAAAPGSSAAAKRAAKKEAHEAIEALTGGIAAIERQEAKAGG